MTSDDIHKAMREHIFNAAGWSHLKEFRAGTGWGANSNRYLDLWAMQTFPSLPMSRVGVEIKISRQDWRKEMRDTLKRDAALQITTEFYFACPEGLIREADLPVEAGLIWAYEDGRAEIVVPAPHRENLPTWVFVASLARRAAKAEGNL